MPNKNIDQVGHGPIEEAADQDHIDKREANREWAEKAQGKDAGDTLPDPLPGTAEAQ